MISCGSDAKMPYDVTSKVMVVVGRGGGGVSTDEIGGVSLRSRSSRANYYACVCALVTLRCAQVWTRKSEASFAHSIAARRVMRVDDRTRTAIGSSTPPHLFIKI